LQEVGLEQCDVDSRNPRYKVPFYCFFFIRFEKASQVNGFEKVEDDTVVKFWLGKFFITCTFQSCQGDKSEFWGSQTFKPLS